jgi:hypothetical protein
VSWPEAVRDIISVQGGPLTEDGDQNRAQNFQGAEVTTRLRWRSRASKKTRAAAVEAAKASGFSRVKDDGEALCLTHKKADGVSVIWMFLLSRLFTDMETK